LLKPIITLYSNKKKITNKSCSSINKKEKENKNRNNFIDVSRLPERNCSLDVEKFY